MRRIDEVITALLGAIPETEVDFREELQRLSRKANYTAPEVMHGRWLEGAVLLDRYIGKPPVLEDWQQAVVNIWVNKT
jgi:hypothetical protein